MESHEPVVRELPSWSKKRTQALVYLIFFGALGCLFLALTAHTAYSLITYPTLDGRTSGTVTYEDRSGRGCSSELAYEVSGRVYSTSIIRCPGLGTEVPVRYAPDQPSVASAKTPAQAYIGYPVGLGLTGVLTLMFFGLTYLCGRLAAGRLEPLPPGKRQDLLRRLGIEHRKPRAY